MGIKRQSNEAAKKAANGTHIAISIDNLQFDEGSSEQSRLDLMVKGLSQIGLTRRNQTSMLVLRRTREQRGVQGSISGIALG